MTTTLPDHVEHYLAAHISATPPLSITEAIAHGYAPIRYERIFDLAPTDPLARFHWCLNEMLKAGYAIGLDSRTIIGRVDFAADCEADR